MLKKLTAVLLLVLLLVGCAGGGAAVSSSTPEESKPAVSSKVESKPVSSVAESKPAVSSKTESKAPQTSAYEFMEHFLDGVCNVAQNDGAMTCADGVKLYEPFGPLGGLFLYLEKRQPYNSLYGEYSHYASSGVINLLSADDAFPLEVRPVWEEGDEADLLITLKENWSFHTEYPLEVSGKTADGKEQLLFSGNAKNHFVLHIPEFDLDEMTLEVNVTISGYHWRGICSWRYDENEKTMRTLGSWGTVDAKGNYIAQRVHQGYEEEKVVLGSVVRESADRLNALRTYTEKFTSFRVYGKELLNELPVEILLVPYSEDSFDATEILLVPKAGKSVTVETDFFNGTMENNMQLKIPNYEFSLEISSGNATYRISQGETLTTDLVSIVVEKK